VAELGPSTTWRWIAPDHLGAPHQISDPGRNAVWLWNHDPFGDGAATGSLSYNLRLPGQYFDSETGLHYNGYRDYDPSTGRYVQSDPIGLAGGVDPYAYATEIRFRSLTRMAWMRSTNSRNSFSNSRI
jgi:RHS repeat-associated protein